MAICLFQDVADMDLFYRHATGNIMEGGTLYEQFFPQQELPDSYFELLLWSFPSERGGEAPKVFIMCIGNLGK